MRRTGELAWGIWCLLLVVGCGGPKRPPAQSPVPQPQAPSLSVTGAGSALSRVTSDPVNEFKPNLSPDGKTLLFHVEVYDARGQLAQASVVGVDPQTGARRTIYTPTTSLAQNVSWVPDGSSFVFSSNSPGSWSLVRSLASAPNAAITVITGGDNTPLATQPAVSPDSKRVAFTTRMSGSWTLAMIGLDNSRLTLLGEGSCPSWSPDNKHLAFQRTVGGYNQIFTIDTETGTNLVQVTNGETPHNCPSWSPDGRFIAFTSSQGWTTRAGASERSFNLFLLRPDGTGLTKLTDGIADVAQAHWARDGWIYFASNQSGNYDIWRLLPAGEFAVTPSLK